MFPIATKRAVPSTPKQSKPQPSSEVDLDIAKMVQEKTVSASPSKKVISEESIMLHIWDFAGQDLYYTTHQVCFCILVMTVFEFQNRSSISVYGKLTRIGYTDTCILMLNLGFIMFYARLPVIFFL